jgi:hypothetical protein
MLKSRAVARRRHSALLVLLMALVLAGLSYGWYYLDRPGTPPPRSTLIRTPTEPPVHRVVSHGHTSLGR